MEPGKTRLSPEQWLPLLTVLPSGDSQRKECLPGGHISPKKGEKWTEEELSKGKTLEEF